MLKLALSAALITCLITSCQAPQPPHTPHTAPPQPPPTTTRPSAPQDLRHTARDALQSGDLPAARRALLAHLHAHPEDPAALLLLAQASRAADNPAGALNASQRALRAATDDATRADALAIMATLARGEPHPLASDQDLDAWAASLRLPQDQRAERAAWGKERINDTPCPTLTSVTRTGQAACDALLTTLPSPDAWSCEIAHQADDLLLLSAAGQEKLHLAIAQPLVTTRSPPLWQLTPLATLDVAGGKTHARATLTPGDEQNTHTLTLRRGREDDALFWAATRTLQLHHVRTQGAPDRWQPSHSADTVEVSLSHALTGGAPVALGTWRHDRACVDTKTD